MRRATTAPLVLASVLITSGCRDVAAPSRPSPDAGTGADAQEAGGSGTLDANAVEAPEDAGLSEHRDATEAASFPLPDVGLRAPEAVAPGPGLTVVEDAGTPDTSDAGPADSGLWMGHVGRPCDMHCNPLTEACIGAHYCTHLCRHPNPGLATPCGGGAFCPTGPVAYCFVDCTATRTCPSGTSCLPAPDDPGVDLCY